MPITNAILNDKGKVDHYVCTGCGCIYLCKFQDTTLCLTCLKPVFHDIEKKIIKGDEKERAERALYAKNWVNKKNR